MKITTGAKTWEAGKQAISAAFNRVPTSVYTEGATHSGYVANDPIYINHTLGEIPTMYSVMTNGNYNVYSTAADMKAWSESQVIVRVSAAGSTSFLLHILGAY